MTSALTLPAETDELTDLRQRFAALADYVQALESIRHPALAVFDYAAFKRLKAQRLLAGLRDTGELESAEYHVAREIFYAGVRAGEAGGWA